MLILGSASDIAIAEKTVKILEKLEITYTVKVASAHRTHEKVKELVQEGTNAGVEVFIAIAGLAAHLPGVIAAYTNRPVIGVPVEANFGGLDALYASNQMPFPVPVATVGIGRGDNAGILAGEIIATYDDKVKENISKIRKEYKDKVESGEEEVLSKLNGEYLDKDFLSDLETDTINVESVENPPSVCIVAGSYSDMDIAKKIKYSLERLEISYDLKIISPLRNPEEFEKYIRSMSGVKLFIAVNGLSALVAGSIVGLTEKPVIGVPRSSEYNLMDSLLSMVQMPPGVPIATVGVNNGGNAAILAGEIVGLSNEKVSENINEAKKQGDII